MDADVLPLLPLSHLFRISSSFAAVPDVGWPDIFNSGVIVLTPGEDKFNQLMGLVVSEGSWDGGDQGILNEWRGKNWDRLSFTYNTTPTAAYRRVTQSCRSAFLYHLIVTAFSYAPAYKRFGSGIKAIHFIGPNKPWMQLPFRAPGSSSRNFTEVCETEACYDYPSLLDRWFAVFDRHFRSASPVFSTTGELMPTTFQETIYTNAWDQEKVTLLSGVTGGPLALDKLRQLAVKGFGQIPTREKGEGAYMTLPLDGRISLMSPPRSEMRRLYAPGSRPAISLSRSSTISSCSQGITTPADSSHSDPSTSPNFDESVRWDPWSGVYSNMWDLVPEIQRIASQQFGRAKVIQTSVRKDEVGKSMKQELVYRSWEDRTESTSRDGDDEAEEEEGK